MLDLLYDLTPDECISHIEGHLLVLALGEEPLSEVVSSLLERRVARLDDSSEFRLATCRVELFPELLSRAQELPALFHFLEGKMRSAHHGADECVEFFEEFVIANRCKRNGKRI